MQGSKRLSGVASVMGIGHTDWVSDHAKVRAGEKPHDSYGYAAQAFLAALQDSGIDRSEIDGLIVGPTTAYERVGEVLGLDVRWGAQADAMTAVIEATMAIASGMAEVVALVYGNDQRSAEPIGSRARRRSPCIALDGRHRIDPEGLRHRH